VLYNFYVHELIAKCLPHACHNLGQNSENCYSYMQNLLPCTLMSVKHLGSCSWADYVYIVGST